MTGFRPLDWDDDEALSDEALSDEELADEELTDEALPADLKDFPTFNFTSLSKGEHLIEFSGVILISIADLDLLHMLVDFVLEYTFTGNSPSLNGPMGDTMVEFGMSRFRKQKVLTDEPLAILALVTFFRKQGQTLAKYLTHKLNTPDAAYWGISFEAFGAYLLAQAFSVPKTLSEIFEFVGGNQALQNERAELVALEKVDHKFQTTPLRIETNLRSCHILGCSPSTNADTLEWLQDPQGSAFCFPANSVSPDLIFVLRLTSDNTVLHMMVQFKHMQSLSPQQLGKAIRTTNPLTFLSRKSNNNRSPTCSDPSMRNEMVEAIKNLGDGTKKAGPCRVLRVIISHPSVLDDDTLEEAAK